MRRSLVFVVLMLLMSTAPMMTTYAQGTGDSLVINEIYASPNTEEYGGIDWNGDGEISRYSNQFVEVHNPTEYAVDMGGWWIDDIADGGSPACSVAWGTTIEAGAYVVFYRAQTNIELDYFDGDTVSISDSSRNLVDSVSYDGEDSDYGVPYGYGTDGNWAKLSDSSPTPGGPNDQEWVGTNHLMGNCYPAQDQDYIGQYILEGRIVTMESQNSVIDEGRILVNNGMIEAVWSADETAPAEADGVPSIPTSGTIYPGLIDLHNHMHYNHIPLWDFNVHLSDSQKSEEGGYTNRYQWGDNWDYGPSISWMKNNIQSYSRWDMASEQMKYAEVQAVAGGVTAVQGSPSSGTDSWDSMLSRNVELYNFGQDGMYTCAVCGPAEEDYNAQYIIEKNESGTLNAWFVHLSEGVDSSSKAEFDSLYNKGLIMDETVVIHGTALDSSQFAKMGEKGAGLVWSPISNLLLYGDTTDVVVADNLGVTISLAPDWGPSGSKNNLHELKVADMWNRESLDNHFSDFELVEMVTSNAAEISNWQEFVGQISPGMYADLVVVDTFHENPYRNLIEAIDPDIRLTIVQGKAVFGDIDIMTAMKGDDWEYIQGSGFNKAVDVTSTSEVDGMQSWENIELGLSMAMRNEFDDIKANWNEVSEMSDSELEDWLGTTFDGDYRDNVNHLKSMTLDPIFTINDERYFDVINRSAHANYHIDMSNLYDYYDIELDEDGHRVGGTVGGADPIETNITNGNNNGNGNGGTNPVPEPELPGLFSTYGPRGATLAHPTTIDDGIHLEACNSDNGQTTPDDKELLCGSILVVMQPTDECIVLEGSFCLLDVEDAFAVPGKLCEDSGIYPSQVTCRDAWSYLDVEDDETTPEPEPEPEEENSWTEGPLFWVTAISLVGLLIASVVMINNNLRNEDDNEE